jgi:hypothetical protein
MSQWPHDYTPPNWGPGPHPFEDPSNMRIYADPPRNSGVDPNEFRYEDEYRAVAEQAEGARYWSEVAQREAGRDQAGTETETGFLLLLADPAGSLVLNERDGERVEVQQ